MLPTILQSICTSIDIGLSCTVDERIQEVIDTSGFFARHGRHRRAAVLPVPPSPETDVATDVVEDSTGQRERQRRDAEDDADDNKVFYFVLH